mgnify:CR=1 FL=1
MTDSPLLRMTQDTPTCLWNDSADPKELAEAIGWGLGGEMPKIIPNTNDNYAQTVLAVWLAWMAFGVLNENFLYSLRTS